MMKRALFVASASLGLIAGAPLSAQDEDAETVVIEEEGEVPAEGDPMAGMLAMLGGMFAAEPLTAEQEARLPIAESIAAKILPDGAMSDMFKNVMGGFLGPLMEMGPSAANSTVSEAIGVNPYDIELSEEQVAELAGLLDPAYEERKKREAEAIPVIMSKVFSSMEPGMRKAMSELFAIRFEQSELAELDAFFSTAVGAKYARESYTMATDPRMLAASFENMPQIMSGMSDLEGMMAEVTADLPAKRPFAELSDAEKARVSELTGYSVEEIEEMIATMAEAEAMAVEWEEMGAAEAAADEAAEAVED